MNLKKTIHQYLDHTNVKSDATSQDIKKLCQEAIQYQFHSVCVSPYRVKEAKKFLDSHHNIKIIAVISFPFGYSQTKTKVSEALQAIKDGATEIDMVANIGAIKEGDWLAVKKDIAKVAQVIKPVSLKVILEVGYLTSKELFQASQIAKEAGAKFVKTSTGYGPRPAKINDIKIMKKAVGPNFGIKASGGIQDFTTAEKMVKAGATRIGTSRSLKIIGQNTNKEEKENLSKSCE